MLYIICVIYYLYIIKNSGNYYNANCNKKNVNNIY